MARHDMNSRKASYNNGCEKAEGAHELGDRTEKITEVTESALLSNTLQRDMRHERYGLAVTTFT